MTHILDRKFLDDPTPFFVQSAAAAVIVFLTLFIMRFVSPVIIAAIGSTAFVVFAMPNDHSAAPRCIIGGHLIGMTSGIACALIPHGIAAGSIAVALSIFFMVILDAEHPPAAGTAMGSALAGFTIYSTAFIVGSATFLAGAHIFLRRWMTDLV